MSSLNFPLKPRRHTPCCPTASKAMASPSSSQRSKSWTGQTCLVSSSVPLSRGT
uniref:Uncharacterized protein n=1 Tax=Arundo donax TaxID=35708 RepID=A0A0A9C4F3_ARUDO